MREILTAGARAEEQVESEKPIVDVPTVEEPDVD